MSTTHLYPNPFIFFFCQKGEYVAWDYKHHRQYVLTTEYMDRITYWDGANPADNHAITSVDQELAQGGLLLTEKPAPSQWGWDKLAHIFHVGTKDIPQTLPKDDPLAYAKEYVNFCNDVVTENKRTIFEDRTGDFIKLDVPCTQNFKTENYWNAVKNRMTSRHFNGAPMDYDHFNQLLYASFGLIHGDSWGHLKNLGLEQHGAHRAAAGGGGLASVEAYPVVLNVDGVQPGVYHYSVKQHGLTRIKDGFFEDELVGCLLEQFYVRGVALGVFYVSRFDKLWWKYPHSRSYRVGLLDMGHMSQLFQMNATVLGMNTWICGAFADSRVENLLQVDGEKQAPLFFTAAGYGERTPVHPTMVSGAKSTI